MAEKKSKSRALKAVNDTKNKTGNPTTAVKKKEPLELTGKKGKSSATEQPLIPGRALAAVISLILSVLFLFMAVKPDGALLKIFLSLLTGLVGKVGFYFAIPATFYLFLIPISSKGTPVKMRAACLILFVLFSSSIHHLIVNNQTLIGGFKLISDLYVGGITGTSGGLICGLLAMLIRWACGDVLSYVLLGLAAILMLMASMKITLPSIVRAIQNRPRDDWQDEEIERPEPAARVVNHIANKRIEQKRQQRQKKALSEFAYEEELPAKQQKAASIAAPKRAVAEEVPLAMEPVAPIRVNSDRAAALMNQIADFDVAAPSDKKEDLTIHFEEAVQPKKEIKTAKSPKKANLDIPLDDNPSGMPAFIPNAPLPDAPKLPIKSTAEPVTGPNAKVTSREAAESARQVADEIALNQSSPAPVYCFPPIDLLKPPARSGSDGTLEMKENSKRLNETLASFKIDAHIINVTRGPSVTRYEVELDKGVRLNKLTSCADDIALSLGASGVRIAAVPGKISVVGIEVPNRSVTNVNLREVIDSPEFNRSKSKSTFAVGKDIGGTCIVGNIAKMPHMLIAGTTGSGKSVCMNSIIISLLYKASPDEVKLIMVDPKMVELGIYNGIPHLLIPVVTDPKKAAGSLQWAVTEMLRRYKIMSEAGVRDLESYNSMVLTGEVEGEKLPQIVVIIDELADLMLVAAKEVEDSICRIAQMGRASGMHLIIATQRPSADVITGLMKANIPSRIAFSVASAMESRIILDTMGAEKLVGRGDMLFSPIGTGKPQRVQGCFVTDGEVEAVANYVKQHYIADYDQQVLEEIEKKAVQTGKKAATADPEPSAEELDGDELLPAAVDVILETGQASVSMLQRRLKLGYARAARIVDEMEEKGFVGPFQGSKPRSILITKEQWEAKKNGMDGQMQMDDLPFDPPVPDELL